MANQGRSVVACAAACGHLRIDQDEEGAVGKEPAGRRQIEVEHALDAELARDALVGERRVDVAVAEHVPAGLERGSDHARN